MTTAGIKLEQLGRYRLIEQIGRGGMASVFKAFDPVSEDEVAIKVLSPVLAQEQQFTKRFEREAEVVMRLSHPNIVPVIDYGQDSGFAYLVMPLLQVGSLADRLAEGPLTPAEGGRLLTQLAQALQFAHDQGVVHRDVKPSNVLMDENGGALLADFGLARIHDASVSLTGSALLGTPAYMSPEQARGEKVGPASDQYSMGIILYQLCTGNLPFEAETPMAVMLKHINEPVPLARKAAPNVPEAIEHVILKATAKVPEQRFGSVTELNAAFQAALAHARDPFANPAPRIELPPSNVTPPASEVGAYPIQANAPKRSRLSRLAGAAALLLLLGLACPVALLVYNGEFGGAAEGSGFEDMSEPQLTALAGTISALSTELAAAGDGTQSPEQIQTAVMGTLAAGGDPFAEASETPGPFVIGGGTPTATPSPGPSPTPSLSPTPGPSPTPSKTPTITQTPSPGPSPTPSRTPTPSNTPTASATATIGPSPTPSKTATKTASPSLTASPLPSKTPTPLPTTPSAIITPTDDLPPLDPCDQVTVAGYIFSPPVVGMAIRNGNGVRIELQWIHMDWPPPNEKLQKFDLAGGTIWDEGSPAPPTWATSLSGNRKIGPGDTQPLVALFNRVEVGPYLMEVGYKVEGYSADCILTGSPGG